MKKHALTITANLALLTGSFLLVSTSQALPLLDVHLKANAWQTQYSGEIGQNNNTVSFDDLGFDKESTSSFSITLRHPVPLIPNIKFQKTALDTNTNGTIGAGQTFEFEGETYTAATEVNTKLDLSHTDLTAFYSFLYFDVGLTARNFDTQSSITDINGVIPSATAELDGWIPMLYAGVNADLPFTGVYIDASLNTISYDGNGLQDLSAAVGYNFGDLLPLTAELGYRKMSLDLEDLDDVEGDFTIDGWFLSLGLAF